MPIKLYPLILSKFTNYSITITSVKTIYTLKIRKNPSFGIICINNNFYNFNYFNDNNNRILLVIDSADKCIVNAVVNNIEIKQIYIAEHLVYHFKNDLLEAYTNLMPYYDHNLPAIFYGIWSKTDLDTLKSNKSLKIIVWTGGDIDIGTDSRKHKKHVDTTLKTIKTLSKIKHIAISKFIENDLIKLGINPIRAPFMGMKFELFKPVIKGNSIYIYTCADSIKYGSDIYIKIIEKYKDINFILTCCKINWDYMVKDNIDNPYNIKYYPKDELINNIYPQCFIGLRLTTHDGLAGTVQELGAMGIKCIHNGDSPSSLNYTSFEDICNHIDNEMKTIGTCDEELAENVKKYLTIPNNFFNTSFFSV